MIFADPNDVSQHSTTTRCEALYSIYNLAINNFAVRYIFIEHVHAVPYLHLTHSALMHEHNAKNDRTMLLSACRQALVCTEDNVIHGWAKDLSYMLDPSRRMDLDCFVEAKILFQQLDNFGEDVMYGVTFFARHDPMSHLYSSENISNSDGAVLLKLNPPMNTECWLIGIVQIFSR